MTIDMLARRFVSCDGNGSADGLGHPRVFLNLAKEGRIDCTYCGRIFVYQKESRGNGSNEGHEEH